MVSCEILEKLSKRVIKYMQNSLQMREISESFLIQSVEQIQYNEISSFISLSGDISGTIGISTSNDLSKTMVKNFIFGDINPNLLEELSSENLAEILNITLGNIIKDINIVKNGGRVEISTPFTLNNSKLLTKKKDEKMYKATIKYNNETVILSYII